MMDIKEAINDGMTKMFDQFEKNGVLLKKGVTDMMFNRKAYSFENKVTEEHKIHYSRYIASWLKIVLKTDLIEKKKYCIGHYHIETVFGDDFGDWLKQLGLNEDEIREIKELATNGKLELEDSAYDYIVGK